MTRFQNEHAVANAAANGSRTVCSGTVGVTLGVRGTTIVVAAVCRGAAAAALRINAVRGNDALRLGLDAAEGVITLGDHQLGIQGHRCVKRLAERIRVRVTPCKSHPEPAVAEFLSGHNVLVAFLLALLAGVQRRIADHHIALFAQLQGLQIHVVSILLLRLIARPEPIRGRSRRELPSRMNQERCVARDQFDVVVLIGTGVERVTTGGGDAARRGGEQSQQGE